MSTWTITLQGDPFDLAALADLSGGEGSDWSVTEEGSAHVLRSSRFEPMLEATKVREAAEALVELINGLARIKLGDNFAPVQVGAVVGTHAGGLHELLVGDTLKVSGGKVRVVIGDPNTGKRIVPESHRLPASWVLQGEQEPRIRKVARLMVRRSSWEDLFKVLEVIAEDVGGQDEIVRRGWSSSNQLSRFTGTANNARVLGDDARHGHERWSPPANPMGLEEAAQFIRALADSWLSSKGPGSAGDANVDPQDPAL